MIEGKMESLVNMAKKAREYETTQYFKKEILRGLF